MAAIEAPGADRESDGIAGITGRRVIPREDYALLVFPLSMLAVFLVLALTLGVSPPG